MNEGASILWLCLWIPEKLYHVVEVWDLANSFACLPRDSLCLSSLYGIERPQLAIVEAQGLSKFLHIYTGWYNAVKFGQGLDSILPPVLCQSFGLSDTYVQLTWRLYVLAKHRG